jgi:hypothetical protein
MVSMRKVTVWCSEEGETEQAERDSIPSRRMRRGKARGLPGYMPAVSGKRKEVSAVHPGEAINSLPPKREEKMQIPRRPDESGLLGMTT